MPRLILYFLFLIPFLTAFLDAASSKVDESVSSSVIPIYRGWAGEAEYEESRKHLYGIDSPVDYDKGYKLLRQSADKDFPPALTLLGWARFYGQFDLMKRKNRGLSWWEIGAELGDPYCAMSLAEVYLVEHYKSDLNLAEKYLEQIRACDEAYLDCLVNDPEIRSYLRMQSRALYLLGLVYKKKAEESKELEKQKEYKLKAFDFFKQAEAEGNSDVYYELATAYAFGVGVERDFELADSYLEKSVRREHSKKEEYYFQLRDQNLIDQFSQYELQSELEEERKKTVYKSRQAFADQIAEANLENEMPIEDAIKWYELAAEGGREWAMLSLAYLYWNADKIEQDVSKAFKWFKKASDEGGHALGSYNAGVMYRLGIGTEKSEEEALKYFNRGVNAPFYASYAAIHDSAVSGREILSYDEALKLCKKAAKKKAFAQYCLAKRYDKAWGVKQNFKKAHKLYAKAAKKGLKEAQYEYGKNFTYSRFGRDYKKAIKWLKLASDQGHADACYETGSLYHNKVIFALDTYGIAYEYYQKCLKIDPQHKYALNDIGVLYDNGRSFLAKDDKKAVEYYEKAAAAGGIQAKHNLGIHAANRRDFKEAIKWYKEAAKENHIKSTLMLAELHALGLGCDKSPAEEAYYYRKAAMLGHKESIQRICYAYIYGLGFEKNLNVALRWIEVAYEQGINLDLSLVFSVLLENKMYEEARSCIESSVNPIFKPTITRSHYFNYLLYKKADYSEYSLLKSDEFLEKAIRGSYPPALIVKAKSLYSYGEYKKAYDVFDYSLKNVIHFSDLYRGVHADKPSMGIYLDKAKAEALFYVGCMLVKGLGVEVDKCRGLHNIKNAGHAGHAEACYVYAMSYFEGGECAPRQVDAIEYMNKSAHLKYDKALEYFEKLEEDRKQEEEKKKEEEKPKPKEEPGPQGGDWGLAFL